MEEPTGIFTVGLSAPGPEVWSGIVRDFLGTEGRAQAIQTIGMAVLDKADIPDSMLLYPIRARIRNVAITPSKRNFQVAFAMKGKRKRISAAMQTANLPPGRRAILVAICSGKYSMGDPEVIIEAHGWSLRLPYHSGGVKISSSPPRIEPPKPPRKPAT